MGKQAHFQDTPGCFCCDYSTSQGPNSTLQNTVNKYTQPVCNWFSHRKRLSHGSHLTGSFQQRIRSIWASKASWLCFSLWTVVTFIAPGDAKEGRQMGKTRGPDTASPRCHVAFSPLKGLHCNCLLNYSNNCILRPSEALSVRWSPVKCRSSSCPITF